MKRFIILVSIVFCSILAFAQENTKWSVTFHPGDKLNGLPDRYACIYEDNDFTLQFRSDLNALIVIAKNPIQYKTDSIYIDLYNRNSTLEKTIKVRVIFDSNKTCKIFSKQLVKWLLDCNKAKIHFVQPKKQIELKVDTMPYTYKNIY